MPNRIHPYWADRTKSLKANNYVSLKDDFEDGLKRQVVHLEYEGKQDYESLLDVLTTFVKNSHDFERLLDSDKNQDNLYPEP